MRRELSAKKTIYNAFSFFARDMRMPFGQAASLWGYLAEENRKFYKGLGKHQTTAAGISWKNMKKRINKYPLVGPLGPQDPILPARTKDLAEKLNGAHSGLKDKWGKNPCTTGAKHSMENARLINPLDELRQCCIGHGFQATFVFNA